MTLRAGKSSQYRYYSCNRRGTERGSACPERNIRMGQLDDLFLDQLEKRVFRKDRVGANLNELTQLTTKNVEENHIEDKNFARN